MSESSLILFLDRSRDVLWTRWFSNTLLNDQVRPPGRVMGRSLKGLA